VPVKARRAISPKTRKMRIRPEKAIAPNAEDRPVMGHAMRLSRFIALLFG
jgi:hypothetical protein